MAYKPILFNTAMVKAIMDGSKTQTRRLIKPHLHKNEYGWRVCIGKYSGEAYGIETYDDDERSQGYIPHQYNIGDVLWVRETWCHVKFGLGEWHYEYRADSADPNKWSNGSFAEWRPSIHMPKAAARLFLRVTNVRIERLQDMSAEDCAHDGGFAPEAIEAVGIAPLFGTLWDSTVKKDDLPRYGWDANPWVYVVEFERIDRPKEWIV